MPLAIKGAHRVRKWTLPDDELQYLDALAVATVVYLVAVSGVALLAASAWSRDLVRFR